MMSLPSFYKNLSDNCVTYLLNQFNVTLLCLLSKQHATKLKIQSKIKAEYPSTKT